MEYYEGYIENHNLILPDGIEDNQIVAAGIVIISYKKALITARDKNVHNNGIVGGKREKDYKTGEYSESIVDTVVREFQEETLGKYNINIRKRVLNPETQIFIDKMNNRDNYYLTFIIKGDRGEIGNFHVVSAEEIVRWEPITMLTKGRSFDGYSQRLLDFIYSKGIVKQVES
jgi:hypothetical protein